MLTRILFPVLFLLCLDVRAVRDSTRWDYKLKGIDFKIGGSSVDQHPAQAIGLLKSVTPQEQKNLYNYDNAQVIWSGLGWAPVRINVSAVLSNNHVNYSHFFKGREFRFGLGFDIYQRGSTGLAFRNVRYNPYPRTSNAYVSCTYQCQYLEMGYQLTSRPFLKSLALLAGLNGAFGINTYKRIEKRYPDFQDDYTRLDNNFNTSFLGGYANIGLKYNASCDLNFFMQVEKGFNGYGRGIGGLSAVSGFAVGMRYKIIDGQDRPKYELMKYW